MRSRIKKFFFALLLLFFYNGCTGNQGGSKLPVDAQGTLGNHPTPESDPEAVPGNFFDDSKYAGNSTQYYFHEEQIQNYSFLKVEKSRRIKSFFWELSTLPIVQTEVLFASVRFNLNLDLLMRAGDPRIYEVKDIAPEQIVTGTREIPNEIKIEAYCVANPLNYARPAMGTYKEILIFAARGGFKLKGIESPLKEYALGSGLATLTEKKMTLEYQQQDFGSIQIFLDKPHSTRGLFYESAVMPLNASEPTVIYCRLNRNAKQ